jgi:hypothetical protein
MSSGVLAALITGGCALAVAVYSAISGYRRERMLREQGFHFDSELEARKSELARADAAARARTEYEYSARLSLYQRFEPLLFQLAGLAEMAVDRIRNLTNPSVWADLVLAEPSIDGSGRPPMAAADYELTSTLYGLFAPLAVVRFMTRQLTLVDLSLEERVELPYYLASCLYGSFSDDARLAATAPPLKYEPFHPQWRELRQADPATYWWQGLRMGRLENILDLFTVSGSEAAGSRLCSFGEFEQLYERILKEGDERTRKTIAVASNGLVSFRPESKPVYWRVLIVQACLYQALLRVLRESAHPVTETDWMQLLRLEPADDFRWKEPGRTPTLEDTLQAAQNYLRQYVAGPRIEGAQKLPHG